MTALVEESMYYYSQLMFLPIILILSFGLFQYLAIMYYSRRKEPRGMLLLSSAFLGFAVLVPLAHQNEELVHHLNDVSEACSTLTFLIQITIIGRGSNKKVRIRALYVFTIVAEVLIAVEIFVVALDMIEVFDPSVGQSISKKLNQTVEDVSLAFIFVFRFYYLALIKGYRTVLQTKKMEIFVYALFLTHEYPFMALEATTHVSWKFVQGVYHRLTIVACIWLTVKSKMKNGILQQTTFKSQRTSQSSQRRRRQAFDVPSIGPDAKTTTKRGPSMLQTTASVTPGPREPTAQIRR